RLRVVGSRNGDSLEALEGGLSARGAVVRRKIRVVEERAVRPREAAVGTRLGSERDGRIAIRDEPILEVPGQRSDRALCQRLAACIWSDHAQTVTCRPASVGRLRPGG